MKSKKVIVAMSGGIDSSVAAALLKKEGFFVAGVFMKFWSESKTGFQNRCCSPESEMRARKVAKALDIPFYVFDFKKEFKKRIVNSFLEEHKLGLTPNPCVVCNKEIKFGLLLEKALSLNADFVATGHYVRVLKKKDGVHLLVGKDKVKDQSYFLWRLSQKQLEHVLFPVGKYTKTEVRKLAKRYKLPVLNIPESQEVCFIEATVADFLKRHLKKRVGDITDIKGNVLGQHSGLHFYTIGQRRGLGFSGGPFFVVGKDLKRNRLIITKNEKDLLKKELIAEQINWLSGKSPKLPLKVEAKIRYQHKKAQAVLSKKTSKRYKVIFNKPQSAITPGQSVVFYKGEEILGGGLIC